MPSSPSQGSARLRRNAKSSRRCNLPPLPLVSCVLLPDRDPEFACRALHYFEIQDYPHRELLVVTSGRFEAGLNSSRAAGMRLLELPDNLSGAELFAFASQQARGEILACWSSCDWHGPDRLSTQVAPLLSGHSDLSALETLAFLDLRDGRPRVCPSGAYRSIFNGLNPATLVFRRGLWEDWAGSTHPCLAADSEDSELREFARRNSARLSVLPGESTYCVVPHGRNSGHVPANPDDWPVCRSIRMPAEDRDFYRSVAKRPAGPPEPPLVSCIMPTADRLDFVSRAIEMFLHQDYPARELVIVDDGARSAEDCIPDSPRIRYFRVQPKMTVGAKRNRACREARGEFIAHWDDDDWMAPWRLSYQMERLVAESADACGLNRLLFWDPGKNEAWRYVYPGNERAWVAGGTLLYRKRLWEEHPFAEINVGEDNVFIWGQTGKKILPLDREDFYVATLHSGNTSPKLIEPGRWFPRDPVVVERILGSDTDRIRESIVARKGTATAVLAKAPQPLMIDENPVGQFSVARSEHLNLAEFAAFNHEFTVPRMRRWEIPFALSQARLSDQMTVLDCTINPVNFGQVLGLLYPHVFYRCWNPVFGGEFQPPTALPDESFDRIFCINTLEHLLRQQREELVSTLSAKLRPGGWLIATSDYYFDSSWENNDWLATGLLRRDRQELFGGFNRLTPVELQTMCRRHDLLPAGEIPAEPDEGDATLHVNEPPLVHGTIGAVFYKEPLTHPKPKKVLLSMLTWNMRQVTMESVRALVREARMLRRMGQEAEICVVDNGSADGTADDLRALDAILDVPHRFILNPGNLGNARARNQILDYLLECGADYVLFNDGDIEVVPFSSFVMLRYLESAGKRVGCLGAYSFQQTPDRARATPYLFSLASCELHVSNLVAWTQYGLFRRRIFEEGVRFEERGPFGEPGWGFEDNDLAFQILDKGYQNHYFSGMWYLHRNLSSSVPILRESGVDPDLKYRERQEFVVRKWEGVPHVNHGPLEYVRSVQPSWPDTARTAPAVRFSKSSPAIAVPAEILEWVDRSASVMMDRDELIALAATLASFGWTGSELVVEIGAYIGTTTVMMAKVLEILGHRPTILSIDPFERCRPDSLNPQGIYAQYVQNVVANGVGDRCIAMAAFSADAAPAVPERIGVLVVDGSHHYEAVRADLELYAPKVVPGGFIFLDDYGAAYPDVVRAVDEFIANHGEMDIVAKEYYVILRRCS